MTSRGRPEPNLRQFPKRFLDTCFAKNCQHDHIGAGSAVDELNEVRKMLKDVSSLQAEVTLRI
jgi:hypothetical protein